MRYIQPLLLTLLGSGGWSSRILFYHDAGTKSHLYTYFPLVEELLSRGHLVTGAYYASANIKHENYTEILLPDIHGSFAKTMSALYMQEGGRNSLGMVSPGLLWQWIKLWPLYGDAIIENFKKPEIRNQKADIMISTSFSSYVLANLLDCKVVFISPMGPWNIQTTRIGNNFFPSQTPTVGGVLNEPARFKQRLSNLIVSRGLDWAVTWFLNSISYPRFRAELGYSGPDYDESVRERVQVILSNSHAITHEPQALLENVVHVGGLHIRPSKPLPPDLQKYLDSSPEGVILVSFGSSISPSSMTEEKRKEFINAFKGLKNRIIWKWDSAASDDLPDNVMIRDWLPQQDLLAHSNLKVFVSHGGLLSVMESIYHETLLVGIPLANDQKPNLLRIQEKNIGIMLDWDTLSAEVLVSAINKALTDKSMTESIKAQGRLFRDTPERPVEKAAWWVEFVLRNNGTDFLKPKSMHLLFYQAWNLDILAAGLLALSVSLFVCYKIMRLCCSCCYRCFRPSKQKSE